jgi:hypothetical protein
VGSFLKGNPTKRVMKPDVKFEHLTFLNLFLFIKLDCGGKVGTHPSPLLLQLASEANWHWQVVSCQLLPKP